MPKVMLLLLAYWLSKRHRGWNNCLASLWPGCVVDDNTDGALNGNTNDGLNLIAQLHVFRPYGTQVFFAGYYQYLIPTGFPPE